jgi:hypothetical protein
MCIPPKSAVIATGPTKLPVVVGVAVIEGKIFSALLTGALSVKLMGIE